MIKTKEFKKRRQQLMRITGQDSIVILKSRDEYLRNGDVHYKFRQDSDFYYLTGVNEPDAVLVLCPGSEFGDEILFCREADPKKLRWDGPMLGTKGVVEKMGFDTAFAISEIDQRMPILMKDREKVFFKIGDNDAFDQKITFWNKLIETHKGQKSRAPREFVSLAHYVHDMRLYKSKAEIKCMQQSADLAAEAHILMMQRCKPGLYEYDLQAEYLHYLTKNRSEPSYSPIIGSGENACILHYVNNSKQMHDGELVLIDAGAEYDFYASDVSRTFPVNGKFTARQKDLYQLLLGAQIAAIDKVKPGNHWNEPHEAAVNIISQGLLDLKILKGSLDEVIEEKTYAQYYMHMTGHWLGLDVHDCGDYQVDKLWVELEENMVLTIEPGIYISEDSKAPKKWRGIGIRIEDDVLVSKSGSRILSEKAPKTVEQIEQVMKG